MTEVENNLVKMHTDFFIRCEYAIQNGYYLEAILMEYAAIESRLESVCGVLGLPCGQRCRCRKDVKISTRIECLRAYRNKNRNIFSKSKLPNHFFTDKGELRNWIRERDIRVHGLYKDGAAFHDKIGKNEELAKQGYEYAKLLYNEVKRLRRIKVNHGDLLNEAAACCKKGIKCCAYDGDQL
ncbi:MAG: hypothetical protein IKH18_01250 [Clostridia bacterium]|nr:hypothetical protein [Clostridia bacterium]